MRTLPDKLRKKLDNREADDALRKMESHENQIDFASNDYLGFARSRDLYETIGHYLEDHEYFMNGSTGSRLLSGNHLLCENTEEFIAAYHRCESALIFNSGYNANLGILASIPQREDLIVFDEYAHASIRDGISLSKAHSFKFAHNDLKDIKAVIGRFRNREDNHSGNIYVVTESVFSMDGDSPDLKALVELCDKEAYLLIVDEAHSFGIYGQEGQGLVEELGLGDKVFARIVTFGKALGCHGSAILGAADLKNYLINFARSFIYTTALSPHSFASILMGYKRLGSANGRLQRNILRERIEFFKDTVYQYGLDDYFILSSSAVQSCLIPGNSYVREISRILKQNNYDVRPILSPTVTRGMERLRFCLHSYNTEESIEGVLKLLAKSLHVK